MNDHPVSPCPKPYALSYLKTKDKRQKIKGLMRNDEE